MVSNKGRKLCLQQAVAATMSVRIRLVSYKHTGVCNFWKSTGKCKFGDQCTYLHRDDRSKGPGPAAMPAADGDNEPTCKGGRRRKSPKGGKRGKDDHHVAIACSLSTIPAGKRVSFSTKAPEIQKYVIPKGNTMFVQSKNHGRKKQPHGGAVSKR